MVNTKCGHVNVKLQCTSYCIFLPPSWLRWLLSEDLFNYTSRRSFLDLNRCCISTDNYEPYSVKVQTTSLSKYTLNTLLQNPPPSQPPSVLKAFMYSGGREGFGILRVFHCAVK